METFLSFSTSNLNQLDNLALQSRHILECGPTCISSTGPLFLLCFPVLSPYLCTTDTSIRIHAFWSNWGGILPPQAPVRPTKQEDGWVDLGHSSPWAALACEPEPNSCSYCEQLHFHQRPRDLVDIQRAQGVTHAFQNTFYTFLFSTGVLSSSRRNTRSD